MEWTTEQQRRFDALRQRELHTPLTSEEQRERDELFAVLERAEAQVLAPVLARRAAEQRALEEQLRVTQHQSEQLALLAQQLERTCGVSVAQECQSPAR